MDIIYKKTPHLAMGSKEKLDFFCCLKVKLAKIVCSPYLNEKTAFFTSLLYLLVFIVKCCLNLAFTALAGFVAFWSEIILIVKQFPDFAIK